MTRTSGTLLLTFMFATGCANAPRADLAYRGNGDARILKFMLGNYMSSEAGVSRYLKLHLQDGLPPGRVIDRQYLVERGAICIEGTPVICTFNGIVDEHFSGVPKEHAERAHRVTAIAARVLLLDAATVVITKEASYPDVKKRQTVAVVD